MIPRYLFRLLFYPYINACFIIYAHQKTIWVLWLVINVLTGAIYMIVWLVSKSIIGLLEPGDDKFEISYVAAAMRGSAKQK